MQCERCKKAEASIHLTEIIKDVKSEVHLCEKCARDIGLNTKISGFSLSVPEMLSFLEVSEVPRTEEAGTCGICGTRFVQYMKEGRLGCSDCYHYLGDSLSSVIKSYHGSTRHAGKIPHQFRDIGSGLKRKAEPQHLSIRDMQIKLDEAVSDERFEEAALLRDRIRQAMKG